MLVSGDRVAVIVHWHHERAGDVFDQDGVELWRVDATGMLSEFWAFVRDSRAFDEILG